MKNRDASSYHENFKQGGGKGKIPPFYQVMPTYENYMALTIRFILPRS